MNYSIDWLTFTIKPDKKALNKKNITLDYIINLLRLTQIFNNFVDLGYKRHYAHCYRFNDISVFVADDKHFNDMGICIELTGQGCAYFSSLQGSNWSWKDLFNLLRYEVNDGCALNICRVDFAFDDYDGLLKMDTIEKCVLDNDVVSRFRTKNKEEEDVKQSVNYSSCGVAKTIYFGNKKGNCFCRFYNKLLEQRKKYKDNESELDKLDKIQHWTRFEIVFKNNIAIKIINSMLVCQTEADFNKFLAVTVNGYIRFVDYRGGNVSRSPVYQWWSDFVGTVEHSTLKTVAYKYNPLVRALGWLNKSLAPTLSALLQNLGAEQLFDLIYEFGSRERWKQRHHEIANSPIAFDRPISSNECWNNLVPFQALGVVL